VEAKGWFSRYTFK